MEAQVPNMFCNFYLVKNHKIANNSTTTKARAKISTDLESLKFYNKKLMGFTKFKHIEILLNKFRKTSSHNQSI